MKKNILLLLFAALTFAACTQYPEYDELRKAEDQLVSITQVYPNFNFTKYEYFYVSDSITDIKIDAKGQETVKVIPALDLRDQIVENMEKLGYQSITLNEENTMTDSVLYFDLVYTENQSVEVNTIGYGWWYDYYDPFWYGSYPIYYPSYTYYSSYETKTLVMNCNVFNLQKIKNRWVGMVRGVDDFPTHEVFRYVDQCFSQSPEFDRTNR